MNPTVPQQQQPQQSLWEKLLNLLMGRGALQQASQQGNPQPQVVTPTQDSSVLQSQVQEYMRQKAIQDALNAQKKGTTK